MEILEPTIARITPQDAAWRDRATRRLEQLTMPHWALGRLMDLAVDLAGMTWSLQPPVARRAVVVMAADHGVAQEGVSKYPQEVTLQMVRNFAAGGAGINALAGAAGAKVVVVDMGVAGNLKDLVDSGTILCKHIAPGTSSMARGPAMTREQAVRAVEAGIEVAQALAASTDVFGTGDMGIANTTPSSAIIAALCRTPVEEVTGQGTGIDEEQRRHKISVIKKALAINRPNIADGLDVLAKVGGFEIGGIAGLILGAAALRKPVIVDGFISTAAALIARSLAPVSCEYMIAAHRSAEQGHHAALEHLNKQPLLNLGLRLGEGTGAALAMHLVEGAARILTKVATFEEAAVSKADK
ncbi:MAG: nicotinate-nucleotide--dimethylbenzimidazole phosphoribosyltransferase [Candidatus Hydrogenedentes bacterium]|nr:nicotinate-nucleotide--dimethylbenzimidazole phosphoribosyltransferase [Candidatus Hydrogenedentota bacterium]